jgi:hypothetical protein
MLRVKFCARLAVFEKTDAIHLELNVKQGYITLTHEIH